MKRIIIYLIAVCALASITVGCGSGDKIENPEEVDYEVVEGGEITLPLTGLETLNPIAKSSQSTYYFNKLIYEGLFSVKKNLDVEVNLAESYSLSENARSIDIVLREDISFHDGSKLTSEDVKFTVDVLKNANVSEAYAEILSPLYKEGGIYDINRISKVEIKSPKNIEIYFDRPFSDAPEYLTFPIISKQVLGSVENALKTNGYKVSGTGPYALKSIDILKEVVLSKNSKYWSDKPKIDVIRGKVLADGDLAKVSFEAGRVHAISDLDYLNWESYAQNDKVNINSFPSNRYEFMAFNFKKELFKGESGKAIRNAVFHSVNREHILNNIYLGYGQIVDTPVNPSSWLSGNGEKEDSKQYDLENAAKILRTAGFEDRDGDGSLENENGEKLTFTMIAPSTSQARIDTAKSIAESLRKVGITVEEKYDAEAVVYESKEEADAYWTTFQSELSSENYDLAVLGWEMSYLPDLSFAFHSKSGEFSIFIGYSDKKLDELFEKANSTVSREEKKDIYGQIQKHIKEEKPYISIMYTDAAMINYKRIAGELNPNYMDIYSEIEKWFVPEEFQPKAKK